MALDDKDPGWKFLRLSQEEMLKDQAAKKYDSKKTVWIPDTEEGFVLGEIETTEGEQVTVKYGKGEQKTVNKDQIQQVNPPKYEKTEDMANLTFLNEASVLNNLRQRYFSMLIYTYSGLFCVVINPYKRLPIYTETVIKGYAKKRRNEVPPHLFAVSDEAYRNMLENKENQSMLITGESGAGKTENTKKVIAYFAIVGATQQSGEKKGPSLEDQIVQTNPVLEAFGNAKTVRNNNSSRFGKFIRIHFSPNGKLAGGDIEHYLLEKSRVIKQAAGERCYHIFYQMMSGHLKGLREKLFLKSDVKEYHFVSQAEVTIEGVNDAEEMKLTDEAFDIMGYGQDEKDDLYKITGAIMHMGEMKFKQRPREEQAEADGTAEAELAAKLYGVDGEEFLTALLKPRVKVGTEWVNKGQNLDQVNWAVGALAKANYARMFHWLIRRCNKTLDAKDLERQHFIGVLDIAGFEIFDFNSFEQLWINFVNEKLQQFFNHHMFVLEQEEYQREGIKWEFIDFGLDLQACIELIEKPLGLISMLDEECIVPKASDHTYVDKLNSQHLGKHTQFQKPKPPKGNQGEAHFAVVHYAGTVRYNANMWLEKNKDPLNETAVGILKGSADNNVLKAMWDDYKTQEDLLKEGGQAKKKGKAASFMTVSMMYRESLSNLMTMLHQTQPHFIRCIIPNEEKKSGKIDAPLVLNQLTCNGVLEGIRICRKGFPNRMWYSDFKHRYAILAAQEATEVDAVVASGKMLQRMVKEEKLREEEFKTGHTKIFFKAGVLAHLEDCRDEALSKVITKFQAMVRGYTAKLELYRKQHQREAVIIIQTNIRSWCTLRTWKWFRLYGMVKPMLSQLKRNEEAEKLEARLKEVEEVLAQERQAREKQKLENDKLNAANAKLLADLEKQKADRAQMEKANKEMSEELLAKDAELEHQQKVKQKMESLAESLRQNVTSLEVNMQKLEVEKQNKDRQIKSLKEEMDAQDGLIAKLNQDKKAQEAVNQNLSERLQQESLRNERLENIKVKLESALDENERKLENEMRLRQESEKNKKKMEAELKALQDKLDQEHNFRREAESALKKKDQDLQTVKNCLNEQENLVLKLQMQIHELQARIEQLEQELEAERRGRVRAEKMKIELQNQLDTQNVHLFEVNGALSVQIEQNKINKMTVHRLQSEISSRNFSYEKEIGDLQNVQYNTINKLRDLYNSANSLENEVATILGHFNKS